jgi:LPS-assembly lipoprotein
MASEMIARRRLFALSMALPMLVAGCGWEPLYGDRETQAAAASLRAIKVNPIPERVGQLLETGLRSSLNPAGDTTKPLYALMVTLQQSLYDSGIQSQGLGTRGEVHLTANYRLVELTTNKEVQTGFVHSSDTFDIQANGYSTVVAQNDAATRDVEEVRREIIARLTLYMQSKAPVAS